MGLRLVRRDPDKAYVSDMLWLPKSQIPLQAIRDGLQYWDVEGSQAVLRKLWEDTKHHLVCPREFIKTEQYPQFDFPFVDLTPNDFPKASFTVKHEPRDEDQQKAYEALRQSSGGILNLACGKGKTFLALKHAAEIGRPLLVVVHNSFLFDQWANDAIPFHVNLPDGEKVGVIQGDRFDWRHPITIAMIHSLAGRFERGEIPPEFREYFGMVVYDEVHHLSAPFFVTTAPIITGLRYGLTATEKRADGFDFIYKYHLGDVFYTDLVQEIIPRIYFQLTPVYIDLKTNTEIRDKNGELNIGRLRSCIGNLEASNVFRAKCIQEALDKGRKILAVSHSKNQLINLHKMFPESGLIVEETPVEERSDIVKKSRLSFAISKLGFEGLDDARLDMAFALLPFKQPNDLQQVMGRLQRPMDDKMTPVLVIFDDIRIQPLHGMCRTMQQNLKDWDKHVPGMPALEYTVLNAPKF